MFNKKPEKEEPEEPENPKDFTGDERRKSRRISKNFIMTYFAKGQPEQKYEITQLRNISLGGMCFITTQAFEAGAELTVELKTPYLTETTFLNGVSLGSTTKVEGMLYETRLQFPQLDPSAEFLINKLNEVFQNGEL